MPAPARHAIVALVMALVACNPPPADDRRDDTGLDRCEGPTGLLERRARLIRHYRDGRPAGVKIVGVRPGWSLAPIGLRSGDVLLALDGVGVPVDPPGGVDILGRPGRHTVLVERRGRVLSIDFTVVADDVVFAARPVTVWVVPPPTPTDGRDAYGEWIQRAE